MSTANLRRFIVLGFIAAGIVACSGGSGHISSSSSGDDYSGAPSGDPLPEDLPNSQAFIGLAPDHRHFQFRDGTPFVPVGHNDWTDLRLFLDTDRLEPYLSFMKQNGENVLRLVLDSYGLNADSRYQNRVETRVGEFNPDLVAALDNLTRAAERHGVYLLIAVWCVYENVNWPRHPYNVRYDAEKGLVENPDDLLEDPRAIEAAKNRMRFFIERWGSSPSIFAWELWNEFNVMGTTEQRNRWLQEIGSFARKLETDLYGQHHLRTASANNAGWGSGEEGIFNSPELDFTSYHTYDTFGLVGIRPYSGIPQASPLDPILYLRFIRESARVAGDKSAARPILGTEDVGIVTDPGSVFPPFDQPFRSYTGEQLVDFFIGTEWAGWMGGGAGPSLRWPCTPAYGEGDAQGYRALSLEMYDAQKALRRIAATLDWRTFAPEPADEAVGTRDSDRFLCMALRDGGTVLGWVLNTDPAFSRQEVRTQVAFRSLAARPYRIEWFDMRTGDALQVDFAQGPELTLSTPPFRTFVAFKAQSG
ncbi:MAG: hypothetical protein AB1640_21010 [bacterium]